MCIRDRAIAFEQLRHGLLDRVAGALLRLLQREAQIVLSGEGLLDAVGAMADHLSLIHI